MSLLFKQFKEITGVDSNEIISKYLKENDKESLQLELALDEYFKDIEDQANEDNQIIPEEEEKKESLDIKRMESPQLIEIAYNSKKKEAINPAKTQEKKNVKQSQKKKTVNIYGEGESIIKRTLRNRVIEIPDSEVANLNIKEEKKPKKNDPSFHLKDRRNKFIHKHKKKKVNKNSYAKKNKGKLISLTDSSNSSSIDEQSNEDEDTSPINEERVNKKTFFSNSNEVSIKDEQNDDRVKSNSSQMNAIPNKINAISSSNSPVLNFNGELRNISYSNEPSFKDEQNDDYSNILRYLRPVVSEDFIVLSKSEYYVLSYEYLPEQLEFSFFLEYFKKLAELPEKKIVDYKVLRMNNRIIVLLKNSLKSDSIIKSDYFDLPSKKLRAEIFWVVDIQQFENKISTMKPKWEHYKKQESNYEKKKREKNLEFFVEYNKYKSLGRLVELGLIHLKDVPRYQHSLEILEKEQIQKRVKHEENK